MKENKQTTSISLKFKYKKQKMRKHEEQGSRL